MRNLKKILALVLALVMSLSLVTIAGAKDYQDADDISDQYTEAVEVLSNLGVFEGTDSTTPTFAPKKSITRAEVAAIIYRINTGDIDDSDVELYRGYNYFTDNLPTWAAPYINYCANAKLFEGVGNNQFAATREVTGYEVLAVMLRAMGFEKNEFTGSEWRIKTASKAESLGLTKGISSAQLAQPATRELVAEILFRTITQPTAEYNLLRTDYTMTGQSIGAREFGLGKVDGTITSVERHNNITVLTYSEETLNWWGQVVGTPTSKSTRVADTNPDWTKIGYGAYVWAVPTAGKKTVTAVSSLQIPEGQSLGVSYDRTTYAQLTDKSNSKFIAEVDNVTGAAVYYNGTYVGNTNAPATSGGVYNLNGKNINTPAAAYARVGNRGVKVDFVDTDGLGLAESVIITEYTTAVVSGINDGTNTSGNNAVYANTVFFNSGIGVPTIKKSEHVVAPAALTVGDVVTYVDYADTSCINADIRYVGGDRYVYVSAPAVGTFSAIGRDRANNVYYTIGGENLYTSDIETLGARDYLQIAKLLTSVTYYLDEFGYIIKADQTATVKNYVLGLSNDHTVGTTGLANAYVVKTDGTVANISVAYLDKNWDLANADIELNMYSAAANSAGAYTLTTTGTWIKSISYTKGSATMTLNATKYFVNNQTIVVDVTDLLLGTAETATVYQGATGGNPIPTMAYAKGWFETDGHGAVTVMFVWGTDNNASDEFMVYSLAPNVVEKDRYGDLWYTLSVVRDGKDDTVTVPEYIYLQMAGTNGGYGGYGVGAYTLAYNAATDVYTLTYKSFSEKWKTLNWYNGAIVENLVWATGAFDAAYSYDSNTVFTVLDVENGRNLGNFTPIEGSNYLMNNINSMGFVYKNASGVATQVYIVLGREAAKTGAPTATFGGKNYWAYWNRVTSWETITPDFTFYGVKNGGADDKTGSSTTDTAITVEYSDAKAWYDADLGVAAFQMPATYKPVIDASNLTAVPAAAPKAGTYTVTVTDGKTTTVWTLIITDDTATGLVVDEDMDGVKDDTETTPISTLSKYNFGNTSLKNAKNHYVAENAKTYDWHFYGEDGQELLNLAGSDTTTAAYATVTVTYVSGTQERYAVVFNSTIGAMIGRKATIYGKIAIFLKAGTPAATIDDVFNALLTYQTANNEYSGWPACLAGLKEAGYTAKEIATYFADTTKGNNTSYDTEAEVNAEAAKAYAGESATDVVEALGITSTSTQAEVKEAADVLVAGETTLKAENVAEIVEALKDANVDNSILIPAVMESAAENTDGSTYNQSKIAATLDGILSGLNAASTASGGKALTLKERYAVAVTYLNWLVDTLAGTEDYGITLPGVTLTKGTNGALVTATLDLATIKSATGSGYSGYANNGLAQVIYLVQGVSKSTDSANSSVKIDWKESWEGHPELADLGAALQVPNSIMSYFQNLLTNDYYKNLREGTCKNFVLTLTYTEGTDTQSVAIAWNVK